jgi:hypothetical protein
MLRKCAKRLLLVSVLGLALASCVSSEQYRAAITRVDLNWKAKNDKILNADGRRVVRAEKFRVFTAVQNTFRRLGMIVEQQDYGTGFLFASAPAPVPLSAAEWDRVRAADTGEMRSLAAEEMGVVAWFASLDPVGKDVLVNVFVANKDDGVEVSLGLRLRNSGAGAGGLARRTQAPPTAVTFGLRHFWNAFNIELADIVVRNRDPRPPIRPLAAVTRQRLQSPVPAKPAVEFGRYHALLIGIDNYRNLNRLTTAANDASALARLLREKYGFKTHLLLNPTRAEIVDSLDDLRARLDENDNLLIYYAGHGWLDRAADEGYWLADDARADKRSNWVSNALITSTLRAIKAKHVLVAADSCYSGRMVRGLKIRLDAPGHYARMSAKRARVVITSGGLEPVADGNGSGHSPFAAALISALENNRGILDGTSFFAKVRARVIIDSDQTPQYSDVRRARHDGGDFLFVRGDSQARLRRP